jgi:hypothetical protein
MEMATSADRGRGGQCQQERDLSAWNRSRTGELLMSKSTLRTLPLTDSKTVIGSPLRILTPGHSAVPRSWLPAGVHEGDVVSLVVDVSQNGTSGSDSQIVQGPRPLARTFPTLPGSSCNSRATCGQDRMRDSRYISPGH